MTLKDIVARLERIEQRGEWVHERTHGVAVNLDSREIQMDIAALRLDIERHLLRTEGTL